MDVPKEKLNECTRYNSLEYEGKYFVLLYISKSNENVLKEIILYKTELKLHKRLFSNVEITKPCNNNYIHDVTSMDGILSCHVHCHFSQPELNVALKVSRLQIMYFSDLF